MNSLTDLCALESPEYERMSGARRLVSGCKLLVEKIGDVAGRLRCLNCWSGIVLQSFHAKISVTARVARVVIERSF